MNASNSLELGVLRSRADGRLRSNQLKSAFQILDER